MQTVAERYAAFRQSIEPELAAKRLPDWDENLYSANRSREVPRRKQQLGLPKNNSISNGASPETDADTD